MRQMRIGAVLLATAMGLAACSSDGPADEVDLGIGVTEEPCPGSTSEDMGCIYLGVLSDLTVGPFAAFGPQLLAGEQAFWERVNENGGIGGKFEVNIDKYVRDTEYNPQKHVASYTQIQPDVLGLGETLGTPPTLAVLPRMIEDEMVGAVSTWWSGWEFENNILNAGANYCVAAMNGVEWATDEYEVASVMPIVFPGDYGGDALAGVELAAGELELELMDEVTQVPKAAGGDTAGAVSAILANEPDLVFLTVGPTEAGEIVGGAAARGFTGRFVASHPGFHQGLLASPAADAFTALFHVVSPHENWGGDSAGHEAMRESNNNTLPGNDGYTFGWVLSYPLKAALEEALNEGALNREGLLAAVETMTVDFEGMLPEKTYGDPNSDVVRQSTISVPDKEATASLGLTTVEAAYTGDVAGNFEFTAPCFEIS